MTSGPGPRRAARHARRPLAAVVAALALGIWQATAAAGALAAPPQRPAAPERRALERVVPGGQPSVHVPILMYHYVGTVPPGDPAAALRAELTVSPQAFEQQLDWLSDNGYHAIDLSDLRGYLRGENDLPSRPVVLTFDDGTADLYTTAYPMLLKHDMKAVAFIISGFLDAPGRVTRDQLVQMSRHGIEMGSHTYSHQDLTTEPPDRLQMELQRPKQELEGLVGRPVLDFAYPSGRHNPTVDAVVAQAGYESATTTNPGTAHAWGDRFTWTRVRVGGDASLDQFVAGLGPLDPTEVRQEVGTRSPEPAANPDR
jgi:peptidoglycan/xylan/chitin deacetylase (PgdA/CDA1 family)